jgi:hypothetical protein
MFCTLAIRGTRVRSWMRHCATSQKVASSNPGWGGFFNLPNPWVLGVDSASNRNEYQESSWA